MTLSSEEKAVVQSWQQYGEGSNPDEHVAGGRLDTFRGMLYFAPGGDLVPIGSAKKNLYSDEDSDAPPELLAEVRMAMSGVDAPAPAPEPATAESPPAPPTTPADSGSSRGRRSR